MSETTAEPERAPPEPVHESVKVVCFVMGLDVFVPDTVPHSPVALLPVPSPLLPVIVHDVASETFHETVTVWPVRIIFGSAVIIFPPERLLVGGGGALQRPLLDAQNQPVPCEEQTSVVTAHCAFVC